MLGIELDPGNSDSQDVDRALRALCMDFGLDLIEAMEFIFPAHKHDLIQTAPEIHALYDQMRKAWGPFAQGPAAVVARLGDQCVFSVDSLGLRPLWFGETEKEYFATSERGVYLLDSMSTDAKPLAPGEKIALKVNPGRGIEVLDYPAIQRHTLSRFRERGLLSRFRERGLRFGGEPTSFFSFGTEPNGKTTNGNGHNGNGHQPKITRQSLS